MLYHKHVITLWLYLGMLTVYLKAAEPSDLFFQDSKHRHTHTPKDYMLMFKCQLRTPPSFLSSRSCECPKRSLSPFLSAHHGPLGTGAVPQLHDRLNHCSSDVDTGENLPGLRHGAARGQKNRRQRE
ncbi:hypothetical protein ATANTOWER_005765 [Ataeniobius toweri]|uniref:Secreted protein n=1 Tax=Ataeniobius toweri TaxID=208326 RepID=A0ABU7CHY3_9TELE|nr:hypothetical protein [Ataeniobius toweri]